MLYLDIFLCKNNAKIVQFLRRMRVTKLLSAFKKSDLVIFGRIPVQTYEIPIDKKIL